MKFLSYDSAIMIALGKMTDYFILGILWIFASLGIVTFGAATTAMLYTAEKAICKDEGSVFSTFWSSFAREFKQATQLWLLGFILTVFFVIDVLLLYHANVSVFGVFLLFGIGLPCFLWSGLWYGYLSRFQDTNMALLRNTFRMVLAHFPWVLALAVVSVLAVVLAIVVSLSTPMLLCVIPGLYSAISSEILRAIFKAYISNEETE
jgi:uncharacterized membrane protein YesL